MDKETLKTDLGTKTNREIFLEYLQGNDTWYFKDYLKATNPSNEYDEFKRFVATSLKVNFNDVGLVGSGKTGYSMAPDKDLRDFCIEHEDSKLISDLDLVIVSRTYFHQFWSAYLDLYNDNANIGGYKEVSNNIFRKFISIKNPKPIHEFFKEWIAKTEQFNKDYQTLFGIKHEINYRIYESWDAVEMYHLKGIQELKNKINTN